MGKITNKNFVGKNPDDTHHPFCAHKYRVRTDYWQCRCDYLEEYDKWRKTNPAGGK